MIREVRLGLVCFALATLVIGGAVLILREAAAEPLFTWLAMPAVCGIVALGEALIAFGAYWLAGMRFTEPREAMPRAVVSRSALLPPRRGATLVSVLAAMAIIAICLTLVLQAYLHGGRFVEMQQRRSAAALACQTQIEQARARGYAALPAPGEHGFDAGDGLEGTLVIEAGPQENSRTVTARVRWPADSAAPGGDVEFVTIMTP